MNSDNAIARTEDGVRPNGDTIMYVRHFADDPPDPEKWKACKRCIAKLDKEESLQQAGGVLEALHAEGLASYWHMSDYKVRWRLDAILEELERRIGREEVECLRVVEVIDDVVANSNDDDENTAWDASVDPDEVELDGKEIDWVAVAAADGGDVSNVVDFASGIPSPQKFEACQRFVAELKEDDLMPEVENVLETIRAEDESSNCDYDLRCRLVDILGELERGIGQKHIKRRFMAMLAQHQLEFALYDADDYDGLLRYGFIDSHEYELLQRAKKEAEVNWKGEGF